MTYFYIFLSALNLFCFYVFQDNPIYARGLNLACCVLASLSAVVSIIEHKKKQALKKFI